MFKRSPMVVVARIESGSVGAMRSQIYRAQVSEVIKGGSDGEIIYFQGGGIGSVTSYESGETYLLILPTETRLLTDLLKGAGSGGERLYEQPLDGPIRLYQNDALNHSAPVFLFGWSASLPLTTTPARAERSLPDPFQWWVGRSDLLEHLGKLVTAKRNG